MEETVRSYQELEIVFKDAYDKNDPILLGKLSQIHNMIGLVQLNAAKPLERESEEAQIIYKRAKQHYDYAFGLRSQLESQSPSIDHRCFLSNIRTSLIECLVGIKPIDEEGRESLRLHKLALEACIDELSYFNDRNSYIEYYRKAIDKAEQFLAS